MSKTFDLHRFFLLIMRLLVERGIKLFGIILMVLIVCFVFMSVGIINPRGYEQVRFMFVVFGLIFGPILYIWIIADEFSNESKGISYLLIPNSTLERWLVNMTSIGFYIVSFSFFFRLIDTWIIHRINNKYSLDSNYTDFLLKLNPLRYDQIPFYLPLFLGVMVCLGIFIGVLHFKKNSLIYSLFTLSTILILISISNYLIASIIFKESVVFGTKSMFPLTTLQIKGDNKLNEYLITMPYNFKTIIFLTFIPLIIIVSIIYFFKLKEKQL